MGWKGPRLSRIRSLVKPQVFKGKSLSFLLAWDWTLAPCVFTVLSQLLQPLGKLKNQFPTKDDWTSHQLLRLT